MKFLFALLFSVNIFANAFLSETIDSKKEEILSGSIAQALYEGMADTQYHYKGETVPETRYSIASCCSGKEAHIDQRVESIDGKITCQKLRTAMACGVPGAPEEDCSKVGLHDEARYYCKILQADSEEIYETFQSEDIE